MARENESYRDNLEQLISYFGKDHNLLTAAEVAKFCGKCPRTVSTIYEIPRHGITMATLARRMCR